MGPKFFDYFSEIFGPQTQDLGHQVREYFEGGECWGHGARIFSSESYYYDLTERHLWNPLGINHPLEIRSHLLAGAQLAPPTDLLVKQLAQALGQQKATLVKDSGGLEGAHFLALPSLKAPWRIDPHYVLDWEGEGPGAFYPHPARLIFLHHWLKLMLETDLALAGGKISQQRKVFRRYFSHDSLSLKIPSATRHEAVHLKRALCQHGLVASLGERAIFLWFPLAIKEGELAEIKEILGLAEVDTAMLEGGGVSFKGS